MTADQWYSVAMNALYGLIALGGVWVGHLIVRKKR